MFHVRPALSLAFGFWMATALLVATLDQLGYRLNTTSSLPIGIYRAVRPTPALRVGQLVAACLAADQAALARSRGYLSGGRCDGGSRPVLKRIAALDQSVVFGPDGLTAGGRHIRDTAPRKADRLGRPLAHAPFRSYELRRAAWLSAPSTYSWDSRYYGPVSTESILDVIEPVLLLPGRLE